MKKTKRVLAFLLCLVVISTSFVTVISAADEGVSPCLNNAISTHSNFDIVDDEAIIYVSYNGYSGITTGARITIKLEKRNLLFFWKDVTEWVDTSSNVSDYFDHTYPVSSGKYRVTVRYEISGSGGATDVIEEELKASN